MNSYQTVSRIEGGEGAPSKPTVLKLKVEKIRFIAYIAFWFMCMFAAIFSTLTGVPNTLGPCPLTEGAEPTYGWHCSDLKAMFGFNNICAYWDYSPSREATALIYPIFEYGLIFYIVANYFQIKNDFDNNLVPPGIMTSAKYLFWVKIVLVTWFRMIFVCTVTQGPIPFFGTEIPAVVAHTLGFFGMQFGLVLIAFENVVQVYYMKKEMCGMSVHKTKIFSVVYLVLLFIITSLKVSWASSIFIFGSPWFSGVWPHIVDRFWMFLAAFLPLLFSWHGMKTEPFLEVSIVSKEYKEEAPKSNISY